MPSKEHPFDNIPSLSETQDKWAKEILECQAQILSLLAKENLLDKTPKKDSPLEKHSFEEFDMTDWNKYRKIYHVSFTDLVNLSVQLQSTNSREKILPLIQEIHSLRLNLINSFIPLIHFIARRYARYRNSLFADLASEGYMGLLKCLDSFYYVNPSASIKSYAIFYIKQEMRRFLLENQKGYRIPYIASIKQKKDEGRKSSEIFNVQYFSDIGGESTSPYENNIPSSMKTPPMDAWNNSLKKILEQILDTLPENERTVLTLRYGLDDEKKDKGLSLKKVGETLSLSKERIRQIEKKALENLYRLAKDLLKHDDLEEED